MLTFRNPSGKLTRPDAAHLLGKDAARNELQRQIRWLRRHRDLLTEEEFLTALNGGRSLSPRATLLLFDGHAPQALDAAAILIQERAPAVFFLATDLLDGPSPHWREEIAFIVTMSYRPTLTIRGQTLALGEAGPIRGMHIDALQTRADRLQPADRSLFLDELAVAASVSRPTTASGRFDWQDALELRARGFAIGSYTCSGRRLDVVDEATARLELTASRLRLETRLGGTIRLLAYPDGRAAVTAMTKRLAYEAGYDAAVCFDGGGGPRRRPDRYALACMTAPRQALGLAAVCAWPRIFKG